MPLSIEHERAKFAYEKVEDFYKLEKDEEKRKKFESWAEKLPSMIVSCGLLQTVVFYKSKEEGKPLYEITEKWLKKKTEDCSKQKNATINSDNFNLVEYLTQRIESVEEYLCLADEALKLSIWLKRMSKILKEQK